MEVLKVIFLHPDVCVDQKLEYFLANPYNPSRLAYDPDGFPSTEACGNACWVCQKKGVQSAIAYLKLPLS
jgi:hypothetical protein